MDLPNKTRWYVRDHIAGNPRQVWQFDGRAAVQCSVTNAKPGLGTYFDAAPGEDFFDCIRRHTPWLSEGVTAGLFCAALLGPAEYFPRIARPIALAVKQNLWYPPLVSDKAIIASARNQLTLLVRRLGLICQTVEPSSKTLDAYGHEIRNLLILAATEAEAHWRGILTANRSLSSKLNSNEYVKLIEPLRLLDYAITFNDFPAVGPIFPFKGWNRTDPTRSLGWYDAYNGVKHNRETEFDRGTLQHAFGAVSACIALLVAQFGLHALNFEISVAVDLQVPDWPISEMYLPRVTDKDWHPVSYPGL